MSTRPLPTLRQVGGVLYGSLRTLKPFYPHLAGLGVMCGLGIAVAANTIFAPLPANLTQDRWGLIQWQPYHAGPLREDMMNARLWGETPGGKVEAAPVAPVVPQWRFVGIVSTGARRVAVIEVDAAKIQRFGAGEILPGGARIESVGANALVIAEGGVNRTIKLFDENKSADQAKPADSKPNAK